MAFTSLTQDISGIFGNNKTIFNDDLEADVTLREKPQFKATPSSKRIESGSESTDNVRIEPVILDMDVIFTDDTFAGFFGKTANEKANVLEGYWRNGQRNKVQTGFKLYEDMAITSFDVDRDKEKAGAAFIRVSMKEMRIVSTSLLANAAIPDVVAGSTDQGFKGTTAADPANTSFIASVIDSVTSFF